MNIEIHLASPIIIISIFAILSVLVDAIWKNKTLNFIYTLVGLILTAVSAIYTLTFSGDVINQVTFENSISKNMLSFGGYSAFFDLLFCVAGILTLFASRPFIQREYKELNEFYELMLFAICGMIFIAHSNHLLVLFIGVETMSITFYVLAGYFRTSKFSVEAALKYFLLGSFATGFLLYGMSMVYGATGTLYFDIISLAINNNTTNLLYLSIGFGLLVIGLSFKIAAFPFHQWAPDVYHGSPTVVTGFMSTAGKAAAVVAFIIVTKSLMPLNAIPEVSLNSYTMQLVLAIISAATMLLGNIVALVQKNVKRMLAYSSVAHAGYLLMGVVANNPDGWSGIVFYATAYMLMQIGAFAVISVIERKDGDDAGNLELKDYSGLRHSNPILAALMSMFMLSLAGIPPFAGFFGKYYLFAAAIRADFLWLTIIAVISSIISMYFYIGLILNMYFKEPEGELIKYKSNLAGVTLFAAAFGILLFGVFPSLLVDISKLLF